MELFLENEELEWTRTNLLAARKDLPEVVIKEDCGDELICNGEQACLFQGQCANRIPVQFDHGRSPSTEQTEVAIRYAA